VAGVRLTVRIPESEAASCPAALNLIQAAPLSFVGREGESRTILVVFPGLPRSIDLALRLLGVVIDFPALRLTVDDRPVVSAVKFWTALNCYRDSLEEPDPAAYCARQATRVSDAGGCLVRGCVSHCQFLCARCLQVDRSRGAPPLAHQFRQLAIQAEVEWCPNLKSVTAKG
jgi:hypothetical protein